MIKKENCLHSNNDWMNQEPTILNPDMLICVCSLYGRPMSSLLSLSLIWRNQKREKSFRHHAKVGFTQPDTSSLATSAPGSLVWGMLLQLHPGGSSSSGSSSVGQQELGCSHSAEAKTHCPGNSPDKKRVLMTLASIPTRSDLSGPDILWTDWTYIFCTDYPDGLSGDHNQNLPNGLNASLPPKFLGPCHEATSARSAPSSLDWKQAVRLTSKLTSSQQKWRKDPTLTIIENMLPRGFTAE